jgi:hypothetical protein
VSYSEGLEEQNRLGWYSEHCTQNIGLCNKTTQQSLVFGKSIRDASAVCTVNKGPMQREHTNWTD